MALLCGFKREERLFYDVAHLKQIHNWYVHMKELQRASVSLWTSVISALCGLMALCGLTACMGGALYVMCTSHCTQCALTDGWDAGLIKEPSDRSFSQEPSQTYNRLTCSTSFQEKLPFFLSFFLVHRHALPVCEHTVSDITKHPSVSLNETQLRVKFFSVYWIKHVKAKDPQNRFLCLRSKHKICCGKSSGRC